MAIHCGQAQFGNKSVFFVCVFIYIYMYAYIYILIYIYIHVYIYYNYIYIFIPQEYPCIHYISFCIYVFWGHCSGSQTDQIWIRNLSSALKLHMLQIVLCRLQSTCWLIPVGYLGLILNGRLMAYWWNMTYTHPRII